MQTKIISKTSSTTDSQSHYDAVVLGGGAAGLMCALTAGQHGKRVLVIEVSNKLGKKILMSGGGRCNFTNLEVGAANFICDNPHFVKSALSQYTQWDFISMVARHEIAYHEKDLGQLFCDHSSKQILQMLVRECELANVELLTNCEIITVQQPTQTHFELESSKGAYSATSLVVATGGLSIPTLGGATGLGYQIARQFDLPVNPTEASLVPFTLTGKWHEFAKSLSGVAIPVVASVPGTSFVEQMLFTHRGLSGPAILQLSNYWHVGEHISINLLPSVSAASELLAEKDRSPNTRISNWLVKYLPKSLANELHLELWARDPQHERTLHEFKNSDLEKIGEQLNDLQILPSGTEGYRTAEVTRGGVDVSAVSSKTMQVNNVPNLYFVGEVLDVTGHLGGFNFQWAWSSGYVAGMNV